jgi:hypothetical protein
VNIYRINLAFTTDRPITETELETLKMQAIAQIEEPVTVDGDDVDYITNLIEENKTAETFAEYINSIKPFTVGDLRQIIETLPDEMQILLAETPKGSHSDWFNISHEIGIPDLSADDSTYSALTFFPVDNYDSRQF